MLKITKFGVAALAAVAGLAMLAAGNGTETRAQAPAAAPPLTGTWTVDGAHTNVGFSIRHLGISTVRGRFSDVAGTIVANAAHPEKSSVNFTIQATSIDTDNKMRDDHLRSDAFFDVAKYPQITFQSTRVDKAKRGGYVAVGNLTIHGVTRPVSLPFHIDGPIKDPFGGVRFGLETQTRLNRHDFGVGATGMFSGDSAIGSDVDVTISLEATAAKPA